MDYGIWSLCGLTGMDLIFRWSDTVLMRREEIDDKRKEGNQQCMCTYCVPGTLSDSFTSITVLSFNLHDNPLK